MKRIGLVACVGMARWNPIPLQTINNVLSVANVQDGKMIAMTGFTDASFFSAQLPGMEAPQDNPETTAMLLVTTRIVRRANERVAKKRGINEHVLITEFYRSAPLPNAPALR